MAEKLDRYAGEQDVVVLGLARGGVPVAYEIARTLDLPLDVLDVRKLGAPGHEEFAIPLDVKHRTVIVVDDGLATGATMTAAIAALRKQGPKSIIVAAPVVARDTCRNLREIADACEYVLAPDPFCSVGLWYAEFSPTSDREVQFLLETAAREAPFPTQRFSYQS